MLQRLLFFPSGFIFSQFYIYWLLLLGPSSLSSVSSLIALLSLLRSSLCLFLKFRHRIELRIDTLSYISYLFIYSWSSSGFIKFSMKESMLTVSGVFFCRLRSILRSMPRRLFPIWIGVALFSGLFCIKQYFCQRLIKVQKGKGVRKCQSGIKQSKGHIKVREETKRAQKSNKICTTYNFKELKMLASNGFNYVRRRYYNFVSLTIHHRKLRWFFTLVLAAVYLYRAVGLSYDVITYLIGFYLLQLLVSYMTPKGLEEDETEEHYDAIRDQLIIESAGVSLLGDQGFEFEFENRVESQKPLVSSMSESQIWERITFAFILGIMCTMFKAIEIDVFWPLLMFYFVVLVSYTVQKIIRKMHKYRYSLSDFNKKAAGIFTAIPTPLK